MIARILALLLAFTAPAVAEDLARIVYLGLEDDPYYDQQPLYTGLSLRDRHRPVEGVRLGFRDTKVLGRALGVEFALDEVLVGPGGLPDALEVVRASRPLAILLDLPADEMATALGAADGDDLFVNIRDRSDHWRGAGCAAALLHSMPSQAMLSDALAQHLRARGWTDVLLLHGPSAADLEQADAVRRSADKFGLRIVEDKAFALTNDPRRRDQSNIALLTNARRHDVIWLVDTEGDFGRFLPFATYAARPVVGAEGLTPRAWHWTFERYGAPQLNQRFRRLADRDMTSEDWAAWAGMRALVEAVVQTGAADRAAVQAALRAPDLPVDLYKGVRGSFREWSGQLRQPILLATHNAVIAVAPVEGFEHQHNTLDSLGADRGDTPCQR